MSTYSAGQFYVMVIVKKNVVNILNNWIGYKIMNSYSSIDDSWNWSI